MMRVAEGRLTKHGLFLSGLGVLSALLLVGCHDGHSEATGAGNIVRVEHLGEVTPDEIPQLLAVVNITVPLQLSYTVDIYRVVYLTTGPAGKTQEASAALYVPRDASFATMAALLHGTQTERSAVASEAPLLYGLDALVTAAHGLVAVSPDYLGFGVSTMRHPYLHADATAAAVVDAIRAAVLWCDTHRVTLDGELVLGGYSQGGHAALAAQRRWEAREAPELRLVAVAALSGPHDVVGLFDRVMANPAQFEALFVAYALTTYDRIYDRNRLYMIFNDPYVWVAPFLFDGSYSSEEVAARLPDTAAVLLRGDFLARYRAGSEAELRGDVAENSLLDWTPRAPIRLYHGTADTTVPYAVAVTTEAALRSRGADVTLVPLEGAGHVDGIFAAINPALEWLSAVAFD